MLNLNARKLSPEAWGNLVRLGFISSADVEEVKQAVQADAFGFDFWGLTVDDFGDLLNGNITDSRMYREVSDKLHYATDYMSFEKAFSDFLALFSNMMQSTDPPKTSEEKLAMQNLPEYHGVEGMLIFCRNYFGLPSFDEAGKITLGNYFLARKDNYITVVAQKNLSKIYESKAKAKR